MRELYLLYVEHVLLKEQHSPLDLKTDYKGKGENKEVWTPVPVSDVMLSTSFNWAVILFHCDRRRVAK